MGLTLTLTDRELPASPAFIEFLYHGITGEAHYTGEWYRQDEESLANNRERYSDIQNMAHQVAANPEGEAALITSYRYFKEMLTGNIDTLRRLAKYRFYFVIGIPRTGGTYLTKQLFRACQVDYRQVQNALAHDGFPHIANLRLNRGNNIHTNGLLQLAEYLTMVDNFFSRQSKLVHNGGIVVPKKFTKAIYYYDLIRELFGINAAYLITLRHPLSVCRSILDKSGGMPADGRFAVRSAIEGWALDDWMYRGKSAEEVLAMDYLEVIIGYWKRFQFQIATSGLPGMPTTTLIPYGESWMTQAASDLFAQFGSELVPESFKQAPAWEFEERYMIAAEKALSDVEMFWSSLGYEFPRNELDQGF